VGATTPPTAKSIEKPAELRRQAAEWARLSKLVRFHAAAGSDTSTKVIVLAGRPGVGKRMLAHAVLREHRTGPT